MRLCAGLRTEVRNKREASGLGAGGGNRTPDLLITNQLLYHLSYAGRGRDSTDLCGLSLPRP